MAIPLNLWEKIIKNYPSCPVKELEKELAGKPVTKTNAKHIRLLLTTLRKHENDIRALRKEIQNKLNVFESK
jgi:hypothetical protein